MCKSENISETSWEQDEVDKGSLHQNEIQICVIRNRDIFLAAGATTSVATHGTDGGKQILSCTEGTGGSVHALGSSSLKVLGQRCQGDDAAMDI